MAKMIKKKLRDLTQEEFSWWKCEHCFKTKCRECLFDTVNCRNDRDSFWLNNKDLYSDEFLDQEVEIKANYLNCQESDYLNAVIKPFKDNVLTIAKRSTLNNSEYEYIEIIAALDNGHKYAVNLFPFVKNTMYKNMELDKEYTLEELDL